jgi:hypothetical protein
MARHSVDWPRRSAAGVRIPGSAPRRCSSLERGNNLVGELLVMVAPLRGVASEVVHWLLLGTGLFLNSLPVLAWRPAGQGRASGLGETSEAARPAEPLTRRTIVRDRSLIRLHPACLEPLIFILDKNRAWKSPLARGAASRAGAQRRSQKGGAARALRRTRTLHRR